MNLLKKLAAGLVVLSLLIPYTAFAAEDTYIEETFTVDLTDRYVKNGRHSTSSFGLLSFADGAKVMTAEERQFVNYIVDSIAKTHAHTVHIPHDKTIHKSHFDRDMAYSIAIYMQQDRPDIFYIAEEISMSYIADGHTGLVSSVTLNDGAYTMTPGEIDAAQVVIDEEVTKIAGLAENCPNDLEKVLFVHDYIVSNYEYDNSYTNRTLYTMIRDKAGVCQGYTYLFIAVMKMLHIECVTVPTDYLAHIWNKVKVDNVWYNIDLTYDDQNPNRSTNISHKYFLVNDDEIKGLDPSRQTQYFYLIDEENNWQFLPDAELFLSEDEQYYIVMNGSETIVENGEFAMGDDGNMVIIENGVAKVGYISVEKSCHYIWNQHNWDGTEAVISDSTTFSDSVIHGIKGSTAYSGDTFYCFNAQNDICKVDYENNILAVDGIATNSFRWHDEQRRIYKTLEGSPYYSSTLSVINDKIYLNSDDKVYRYTPGVDDEFGKIEEVYAYIAEQDDAFRAIYGLTSKNGTLYAELAFDPAADYSLFEIPIKDDKPEFPVLDEPLPCSADYDVIRQHTESPDGTDYYVFNVDVTVDIPQEVKEKAEEYEKPVTVNVAQYSADGEFLGFAEADFTDSDTATFTADMRCKYVNTFIWAGNIMPLSAAQQLDLYTAGHWGTP